MSFSYEATIDVHLHDIFRTAMNLVLERQGYQAGLHVPSFGGVGVVEYHKGKDIVTYSTAEEAQGLRHLTVRSETVDVVAMVVSVVEQLATDLTASFWAPATGVSRETLIRDVNRALRRIWKRVASGAGTKTDE